MGLSVGGVRIRNMILAAVMNPEMFSAVEDAISRLKRGDVNALGAIMSRYQHRLYRFLLRLVKDPIAAEDLFQQTWLRLIERIGQYDVRQNFEAWMFTVARHLAIDYLRRQRRVSLDAPGDLEIAPVDHLSSETHDALHQLIEYERRELLAEAITELPVIHREVLSLRFEEEMKLDEIAQITGVPLSTVKSRLLRALENLRLTLKSRIPGGGNSERA